MKTHSWMQIGTIDSEGMRSHTTPGDVCVDCSDASVGRWVPVTQCSSALTTWEKDHMKEQRRLAYWSDETVGWCSATEIFDTAIGMLVKVVKEFSGPAAGEPSIDAAVDDLIREDVKKFAKKLRDADWDCVDESEYYDRFTQEIHGFEDVEYEEHLLQQIGDYPTRAGELFEKLKALHARIATAKEG